MIAWREPNDLHLQNSWWVDFKMKSIEIDKVRGLVNNYTQVPKIDVFCKREKKKKGEK